MGHDTGYPQDGRADNAAYRHGRRADKRRYPLDREIDTMLKMFRNGYIHFKLINKLHWLQN